MTGHLPLPVRVLLQCPRHLHGLRRWAWILGLLYGALPVRVGVLEEDHVPILFAGGAAFLHDVPQGGRRLEEPQLRLEVFLAVLLGLARPEDVARIEEHLGRQGIDATLPDLQLPVCGGPEREVHLETPFLGVHLHEVGSYVEDGDALVVPRPSDVREVALEPWHLVDLLVIGRAAVTAFAPIIEDARMKHGVHPQLGEGLPQREEQGIVRVPARRDQLPGAPQAQLVIAAMGFLDYQVDRAVEVAVRDVGGRNQVTKTEQSIRCGAADVGAIVVVLADVLHVVVGEAPGLHVELGGEKEGLLHRARVHALKDLLGARLTGQVRVRVQDLVHVEDHGLDVRGPADFGHGTLLSLASKDTNIYPGQQNEKPDEAGIADPSGQSLETCSYLNRYWRYMLALSSTSASVTWLRPREATRSSIRLRIKLRMRKGLRLMRRSASGSQVICCSDNPHLSLGVLAPAFYPSG